MTGEIFEKWILKYDRKMSDRNGKIALLANNCSDQIKFAFPSLKHYFKIDINGPGCNKKLETSLPKMHFLIAYLDI